MEFAEALRYLLSLGHETLAIKLGLKNISLLLAKLGNPQQSFRSVQIAGTNGKGSTAFMLESICRAAEIKTGLFTSPHLISITERIRVDGMELTPESFAKYATRVRAAAETLLLDSEIEALPSFFEQVTAIAMIAFDEAGIDLAILETGLGGRLDATTAVGAEVVGITPISMDHEEYLGQSPAAIAAEKAAIIRTGVAALVAAQTPEVLRVISDRAEQCGVSLGINSHNLIDSATEDGQIVLTVETGEDLYRKVHLSLRGRHQVENASLAIRLAEALRARGFAIPHQAIVHGLANTVHPGRLELAGRDPDLLLDGAHNVAGAQALRAYLAEFVRGPITLVFGAMRDKRLEEMARILFPAASNLVLTRPDHPRSASLETLRTLATEFAVGPVRAFERSTEALSAARTLTVGQGLTCVTGSLYLIGEVRASIQSELDQPANEVQEKKSHVGTGKASDR